MEYSSRRDPGSGDLESGTDGASSVYKLINKLIGLKLENAAIIQCIKNFDLLISVLIELDSMIEMDSLKDSVTKQVKFLLINSNNSDNLFDGHMLHTVIYGPPGVGKTRVCLILAKIWLAFGILKFHTKPAVISVPPTIDIYGIFANILKTSVSQIGSTGSAEPTASSDTKSREGKSQSNYQKNQSNQSNYQKNQSEGPSEEKILAYVKSLTTLNIMKSDQISSLQATLSIIRKYIGSFQPQLNEFKIALRKIKNLVPDAGKSYSSGKSGNDRRGKNMYESINGNRTKSKAEVITGAINDLGSVIDLMISSAKTVSSSYTIEECIIHPTTYTFGQMDSASAAAGNEKIPISPESSSSVSGGPTFSQPSDITSTDLTSTDKYITIDTKGLSDIMDPSSDPEKISNSIREQGTTDYVKIAGREDFVGGYLGQSALKTYKLLKDSLGKVLIIDEAYSLVNDEKDSFGREALTVLNTFMSTYPEELIIIFAGYRDMMEQTIFKYQPGLKSRCSWMFNIDGYKEKGLAEIFTRQVRDKGWMLHPQTDLMRFFKKNISDFPSYGRDTNRLLFYCKICKNESIFDGIVPPVPLGTPGTQESVLTDKIITKEVLKQGLEYLRSNRILDGSNDHLDSHGLYI